MSLHNLVPVCSIASQAPTFSLGDHSGCLLISSEQTGGQFAVVLGKAEFNAGPPLHIHEREDETFFILRGQFEVTVGDDVLTARSGDTLFAPRHIAHTWKCVSLEGGEFLAIITPGGFEGALVEVAALLAQRTPEAMAGIGEVFARYGVSFGPSHGPAEKLALAEPILNRAGNGAELEMGDHSAQVLLSTKQTGGQFSLFDVMADYEGGVPPHIHTREDETFYVLKGQFSFVAGGQLLLAGPGDAVFAPRNIAHTWKCISPEGGRAILLVTPGGFEDFLSEIQAFIPPMTEARRTGLFDTAHQYGLLMLPPGG